MLSFKSILKGCQNYIDQCEFDHKDFFNKSKIDKILDDVRDAVYVTKVDLKSLFIKITESDSDNFEKSVMTLEQVIKFVK